MKEIYAKRILIFVACFVCFFFACKEKAQTEQKVLPAFYHWQTHLQLTPTERQLLDSLNVKKLYVKFFDIDWDEAGKRAVPHAAVQIDSQFLQGLEIVPTVFITNRTFKNISQKEIKTLAENIFDKIKMLYQNPTPEIQFDCDWTQSTREKYFTFLDHFQLLINQQPAINNQQSTISATIRLHQLKYPKKTGVPPVDRGMLMFYNTGELDEWETENSILDLKTADQYLQTKNSYPIPLDLALPIFRWGILFRNGELAYLLNNLGEEDLADTGRFAKIAPKRYEVLKSTYLQGYYLYEKDLIRLEDIDGKKLEAAAIRLSRFLKLGKPEQQETVLSFYHLDTTTLKAFHHEDFKNVLEKF